MRKLLWLLLPLLSSCASYPPAAAGSWVHDGNYGPVTTHYEAKDIKASVDGTKLSVGTYSGHIKVLGGYGISDTITDLVISAKPSKVVPTASTTP